MKRRIRTAYLVAVDVGLLVLSLFLSFLIRFEGTFPAEYFDLADRFLVNVIIIKIVVLFLFGLYNSLWEYASIEELLKISAASVVANTVMLSFLFLLETRIPRSIYIIVSILDVMFIGGVRLSYRMMRRMKNQGSIFKRSIKKRVMIVGAGDAGALVIKELKRHRDLNMKPVIAMDDDSMKWGKSIQGVTVRAGTKEISRTAKSKHIDEIIIAIPSASKRDIAAIVHECKKTDCELKILPGVYELINGQVSISEIRNIEIEDLLGRDEVNLDIGDLQALLSGKTVMVTGGAGSIGSELARQIVKYKPQQLILLDINENGLFQIQHELKRSTDKNKIAVPVEVLIASIRDRKRIEKIFAQYQPRVIFHAAAHKHVPLMEESPYEAIKNNVFGTQNLVELSDQYHVETFVQISTDKAVNPTNVMGATKRICEMLIQTQNPVSKTEFVAVRFGNVLGSNGSVIPLFKQQIEAGGPVTVTHPDITRYFMTIPEAAQLVLQAGAMAKGGEIFILDMGEPVKILTLAEDLIRLSGFIPYEDMEIEITGLRPGEKLYEELLLKEEGLLETRHDKIYIGRPLAVSPEQLKTQLNQLEDMIDEESDQALKQILRTIVPTYQDQPAG
ncbi:polysaccharide biosynthesis protein [Acidaminobacter hydrogenoformans]|uniref:NDP-sugar epimerase, includes UDP-GlcNAc-inverting 4,6-dehydratase FlaA1 and capsular polysaccharide biosynthesis protein EpsC n=1 Tax=Acidaminobacter hydrogenoformans DSM 2784 TaxID=1120920 RepID=A0A1G5RYG5_9FIRM|nr:nucleoside-diphosphate sugar epimerase/dehydratase [Acidaminobacter hydrogenoformans]SCZ79046.1 NDP-sugar epimerase, includes UDP-GlcNAc-inverting 4,6-dehydratase FlaA1 and capsular polysaccharide biosynthesis protein EpsC [Acidaminobacter hydrogenoformans DSM 2784]